VRTQERDSKEQFGDAPAWVTLGRPFGRHDRGGLAALRIHPRRPLLAFVSLPSGIRSEGAPPVAATEQA
jgi:hypothetical protein